MKLEHYPENKIRQQIMVIVGKYLDLKQYRIFFFGSRINVKSDERSDIDIGIEGKKPVPLGLKARIKAEIDDLPILYKMDVVDFAAADKTFKNIAKSNIELIN